MSRPANIEEKPQGSDIVLKEVRFTYKEKEVLHGINMEIRQGEVNAIVGPSGSGKSTIARLIRTQAKDCKKCGSDHCNRQGKDSSEG